MTTTRDPPLGAKLASEVIALLTQNGCICVFTCGSSSSYPVMTLACVEEANVVLPHRAVLRPAIEIRELPRLLLTPGSEVAAAFGQPGAVDDLAGLVRPLALP